MLYDFLQLNRHDPVSLCDQLFKELRNAIVSGKLRTGERLTSIRQAASELGISRTTVETAYSKLCMEGYAESKPQSGYHVRAVHPRRSTNPEPRGWVPKYDFGTSSIDLQAADLENWKKLVRAVLTDSSTVTGYGDPQGELALREQLTNYTYRARGVVAEPESIFIGAGVGPLLQLLCPLLPQKVPIVMESPGFSQAEQIFKDFGFPVIVPSTMDTRYESPKLPQLDWVIAAELPSLRPKASSGAVAARKNLLNQWVQEKPGRYVLEDDYNGELRYCTRALPAFQGSCPEKTIYLGSFSKLLLPSVRMAYMVLPPELACHAKDRVKILNQTAGKTEQLAMAEYIRTGLLEKHLRRLRRINARKSQCLLGEIQKVFGCKASCTLYETHLFMILTLDADANGEKLCRIARQAGIACRTAPGFFGDKPQIALGFSAISNEDIPRGIETLYNAWEPLL